MRIRLSYPPRQMRGIALLIDGERFDLDAEDGDRLVIALHAAGANDPVGEALRDKIEGAMRADVMPTFQLSKEEQQALYAVLGRMGDTDPDEFSEAMQRLRDALARDLGL
jgi:hypothetical protein